MNFIKNIESYKKERAKNNLIKEAVIKVNDTYKVRSMVEVPQSLINAYVKKVKDETGDDLTKFFGDVDIAEEIIKYINDKFLDVDSIPNNAILDQEEEENVEKESSEESGESHDENHDENHDKNEESESDVDDEPNEEEENEESEDDSDSINPDEVSEEDDEDL